LPSRLVWAKGLFDQHHVGDGSPVRRSVLPIMPYLLNAEGQMFCFFVGVELANVSLSVFLFAGAQGVDGCGDPGDPSSRLFAGSVSQSGAGVELELDSAKVKEKGRSRE
jgi:hypothetical protein